MGVPQGELDDVLVKTQVTGGAALSRSWPRGRRGPLLPSQALCILAVSPEQDTPILKVSSALLFLFGCSAVSDSLQPHGLQHARLPCLSPTPRACLDPSPLGQRCHPTISSSVFPFSSCLQSFSTSGSFPMSQLCASSAQSIGASASASVLPMHIQG